MVNTSRQNSLLARLYSTLATMFRLHQQVLKSVQCKRIGLQSRVLVRTKTDYKEAHVEGHTAQRFADKAQIEVRGGKGGNGCISHEILSPGKKRPSGGSGGRGGHVFIVGDPEMFSLKFNTYHFNGANGNHGGSAGMTGRSGEDVYIKVPLGTIVSERVTDDLLQEMDALEDPFGEEELVGEEGQEGAEEGNGWTLLPEGEEEDADGPYDNGLSLREPVVIDDARTVLVVARGGAAGVGNKVMMRSKSARAGGGTQQLQSMPKTYLPGGHGDHRSLLLELKIIADVGLVGFPNAGKSSLLRAVSNAQPKVASYRFTTLHPSVGVVEYSDCGRITVADIPGLIEGAHENRGLGHDFLRHIERTKLLLYVVDASASEKGRSPAEDLQSLVQELGLYDEALLDKPALVFANKYDLEVSAKHRKSLDKTAAALGLEVLPGSALEGKGIPLLARRLREKLLNTISASARPGVSERDGDVQEDASLPDADATAEGDSGHGTGTGGRRRRAPPLRRRRTPTDEASSVE